MLKQLWFEIEDGWKALLYIILILPVAFPAMALGYIWNIIRNGFEFGYRLSGAVSSTIVKN
jgi:hypothetical protein